jgi:nitroreductase
MTKKKSPIATVPAPDYGEELPQPGADAALVERLLRRRSSVAAAIGEPGPSEAELRQMLRAAIRVPDHGKLSPWRFVVFEGDARATFGEVLVSALQSDEPDAPADRVAFERERFLRAPAVVAVVSSLKDSPKIPAWEQTLSVGAVCQTLLLAANAHGYAAQWLTEWYSYHPTVQAALGLRGGERIAGFFYIGTARETPRERQRPELDTLVSHWNGTAPEPGKRHGPEPTDSFPPHDPDAPKSHG